MNLKNNMNSPNKSMSSTGSATKTDATSLRPGANPGGVARKPITKPGDLLKSLKTTTGQAKAKKPTILEQAAQDWNKCKAQEDLEEELKQATKSKTGYLDKISFLERSDARQFEKEREIRDRSRARAALNKS